MLCNPYEIFIAKKIANYYSVDLKIADFNYFERGKDLYEEYPECCFNTCIALLESSIGICKLVIKL